LLGRSRTISSMTTPCGSDNITASRYGSSRTRGVRSSGHSMVVLDTDHVSILERNTQPGATTLRAHLAHLPPDEVATTIISYEEHMQGWMAYLAQSRPVAQQVVAYGRLLQHLDNYRQIPILAFDEAAAVVFQQLRRARRRIGTMDLKIAAIVLSRNALLLSKNLTDFGQIPGLQVEDWIA